MNHRNHENPGKQNILKDVNIGVFYRVEWSALSSIYMSIEKLLPSLYTYLYMCSGGLGLILETSYSAR